MSKRIKTNKKDFEIFKAAVNHWVQRFGIKDYEIRAYQAEIDPLAETTLNVIERWADIRLAKTWQYVDITANELNKTAFHEVAEIFLSRIRELILTERRITSEEVDETIHAIIRTMENEWWAKEWNDV